MKGLKVSAMVLVPLLGACGGVHSVKPGQSRRAEAAAVSAPPLARAHVSSLSPPQALVTAETKNRLLVVDLPGGRVARQVSLPPDPENIAVTGNGGIVIVVSPSAGKVTMLHRQTLRPLKTFSGFGRPQIAAIAPDGEYAYVTDEARGQVVVIGLRNDKVLTRVAVGAGAHHLSFSPDQRQVWVALGESARQIVILTTVSPAHPRVIGRFDPGYPAHDLSFAPGGGNVWITSATGPDVGVFGARSRRLLFRVPVGPPPQHVVIAGRVAYLTSGYGGEIEKVDTATGRVIARTGAPYGSFELAAADGYVATSSLLRGTLAIYTPALRPVRVVQLAPATREVAISRP